MTDIPDTPKSTGAVSATLRIAGGFFLAVFSAGIATGIVTASLRYGSFGAPGVIGVGVALVGIAASVWLMLSARPKLALPRSPRVRRSRIALYAALGVSVVVGIVAGVIGQVSGDNGGEHGTFHLLFTSAPISSSLAICALVGWLVAIALSGYWHVTLDEIERAEYDFGASLALYAYVLVAPAWWLAWRGGLAPEPDGMAIFWMVCLVWTIGWAWRRYR